jgi:mannosyltransferase OCH1-like enzyme
MSIPLTIFSHWQPPYPDSMKEAIQKVKAQNPEFTYRLFDDAMCRSFIQDNFDASILYAYDTLIPDAYKSDLWRYCILYILGGVYIDIKYTPRNQVKFLSLISKEHFVQDRPVHFHNKFGVYSGLIICAPGNKIMYECIQKVVENVKNRNYGYNPLYVSGPGVLSEFVDKDTIFDLTFNGESIEYKGKAILDTYPDYRLEQQLFGTPHYDPMWRERRVYR